MSRIGKLPVVLPEKVKISFSGNTVKVAGPKGELEYNFNDSVNFVQSENTITIEPVLGNPNSKSMWGTARTLLNNMVLGVSEGFKRTLEFNGVGYKASVSGNIVTLNLGYSHPIDYKLPDGISAKVNKNQIDLEGCNKELLGFVAAKIRSFRPPEPYKGKGVKYLEEVIIRKAGKTGAKK
jgi:large subunit ribosomal protein L6